MMLNNIQKNQKEYQELLTGMKLKLNMNKIILISNQKNQLKKN